MAACRPRALPSHHQLLQQQQHQQQQQQQQISHLQLQQQDNGLLQQSHYSPQILNWVYLAIEDQNQAPINRPTDQSKLLSNRWGSLPQSQSQGNYLQPALQQQQHQQQHQQQSVPSPTSNRLDQKHYGGSLTDSITDLADYFRDLLIVQKKPPKRPPLDYMCHACFWAGHHYIRDCPKSIHSERRNCCRRIRRAKDGRLTRAKNAASASTSARSASASGCPAIAGPIWARNASNVTLTSIHTSRGPWRSLTAWTCRIRARCTRSSFARSARPSATTVGASSSYVTFRLQIDSNRKFFLRAASRALRAISTEKHDFV
ncbi:uncharacterized protein LOC100116603 isoform X1 [Nasonia vitripennis]|uniref:Zinc knuckle CX2CX3GHX4C domain-containing protein n=1 Tax=Nasonia vitripennis TaxID=7425 RepID=A0A7M7PYX4_NASVI|nr:uncharacterized protein LOC100116603 isoform X1 [Nasonia vitripennis]XP_031779159.1 uncharacterized protein LOC100116603 isoform X1 [Nasonia vitripennis]XP_031779160.1 uncharacterized protein LOC100116603 isoform X1 [Nasonia vitripennis]XP_031779161.1 uncharacterized protein LOC100116603 isoform X1 [Nasonia vitripennis]